MVRVPRVGTGRRRASVRASTPTMLVVAVTAVGLSLRLPVDGDALFGDELSSFRNATNRSLESLLRLCGVTPWTQRAAVLRRGLAQQKVLGESVESLRLVWLLAGTAVIPLVYALGRLTVGVAAGGHLLGVRPPWRSAEVQGAGVVAADALGETHVQRGDTAIPEDPGDPGQVVDVHLHVGVRPGTASKRVQDVVRERQLHHNVVQPREASPADL